MTTLPESLMALSDQHEGQESQAVARLAVILSAGQAEAVNHVLGEMIQAGAKLLEVRSD